MYFYRKLRFQQVKRKWGRISACNRDLVLVNTNFVTTQYRVTLNQSIFDATKLLNLTQAKKRAKKKEISYSNSGQELIFRVIEGYLKVLSAENNLTFAESEAQSLKSQLQRINQRFEVGLVALTDVQEAKAGFDRANAERLKAENELES